MKKERLSFSRPRPAAPPAPSNRVGASGATIVVNGYRLYEAEALSASSIACAAADWFRRVQFTLVTERMSEEAFANFVALDNATRESPLRKVRP